MSLKTATCAPTITYQKLSDIITALGGFGDGRTLRNGRLKVLGAVSVRVSTPIAGATTGDDDLSDLLTADDPYLYFDELNMDNIFIKSIGSTGSMSIRGDM